MSSNWVVISASTPRPVNSSTCVPKEFWTAHGPPKAHFRAQSARQFPSSQQTLSCFLPIANERQRHGHGRVGISFAGRSPGGGLGDGIRGGRRLGRRIGRRRLVFRSERLDVSPT